MMFSNFLIQFLQCNSVAHVMKSNRILSIFPLCPISTPAFHIIVMHHRAHRSVTCLFLIPGTSFGRILWESGEHKET